MSIAVASIFPGGRLRRLLESQADRRRVVGARPDARGRFEWPILVGAGLFLYVLWVVEHGPRDVRRRRARRPRRPRSRRRVRRALPRARAARTCTVGGRSRRPRSRVSSRSCSLPSPRPGVPLVAAAIACLFGAAAMSDAWIVVIVVGAFTCCSRQPGRCSSASPASRPRRRRWSPARAGDAHGARRDADVRGRRGGRGRRPRAGRRRGRGRDLARGADHRGDG